MTENLIVREFCRLATREGLKLYRAARVEDRDHARTLMEALPEGDRREEQKFIYDSQCAIIDIIDEELDSRHR